MVLNERFSVFGTVEMVGRTDVLLRAAILSPESPFCLHFDFLPCQKSALGVGFCLPFALATLLSPTVGRSYCLC
jgi:hypothetical protein